MTPADHSDKSAPAARKKPRKTTWESIRETLDSILIALVLASIFRTFIMEAFEIPTGSMAPTLYGENIDVRCRGCRYLYTIGLLRDMETNSLARLPKTGVCPMCGTIDDLSSHVREIVDPKTKVRGYRVVGAVSGDRILVDKGAYTLSDPKRWEVGVFVNPHKHAENYIKRVIGLPGDDLSIRDGDIYINDRIEPKPDHVQNVLWMPAFDANFAPNGRWDDPWTKAPIIQDVTEHLVTHADGTTGWLPPWRVEEGSPGAWDLGGKAFAYRMPAGDTRPSTIKFNWDICDGYAYTQRRSGQPGFSSDKTVKVGDLRLRGRVTLDGPGVLRATIVDGDHTLDYCLSADPAVPSSIAVNGVVRNSEPGGRRLTPGRAAAVAFVNVDDRAWIEVDGTRPLGVLPYDGQFPPDEKPEQKHVDVSLGVQGADMSLADLRIDRDIYYTATEDPEKAYGVGHPWHLGDKEYFVLGDNSPSSRDSRRWHKEVGTPSPNVSRDLFIGKALVLFWPGREKLWRIGIIH